MSALFAGASFETVVSNTATVSASFDYTAQTFSIVPKIAIYVDGGFTGRVDLAETVTLATGLSSGSHTIKVVYDGQNQYETLWGSTKTMTLKSLTVAAGGSYAPTPNNKKNILFVGDSITSGSYALGTSGNEVANSSAVNAYPTEVAKRLGINDYRVSFGGTGVTVGGGQGQKIQDIVRYAAKGIFADNNPIHTIVVVIGTNDNPGTVTPADFRLGYLTLINNLRLDYPTQRIYLVDVPTANGLWKATLTQIANESTRCTFIPTTGWNSQIATSDGFHPTSAGAVKLGQLLSDAMIADGWATGGGQTPEAPSDVNIWTAPTSFTPLGLGWGSQTGAQIEFNGMAGKRFNLTFKAKSASGQTLRAYTENQVDFSRDIVLPAVSTAYSYDFDVTHNGPLNLVVFRNMTGANNPETTVSDIEITDIYLKQI